MSDTNANWPVPVPDSLGPIYGADDVRDALKSTIDTWAPYYLRMLSGRLAGAGKIGGRKQPPNPLRTFGHWRTEPTFRNLGTAQPAAFLVSVVATRGEPAMKGTGLYTAVWRAHVNVVVFGTTWQEAADLTSWYEKAIRLSVVQHRRLGGLATATGWAGTEYSSPTHTATRTVGMAVLGFDVMVQNVVDASRGPQTVPENFIPKQDPTVETVEIQLTKTPVNQSV